MNELDDILDLVDHLTQQLKDTFKTLFHFRETFITLFSQPSKWTITKNIEK
jgi:hypothetical protein